MPAVATCSCTDQFCAAHLAPCARCGRGPFCGLCRTAVGHTCAPYRPPPGRAPTRSADETQPDTMIMEGADAVQAELKPGANATQPDLQPPKGADVAPGTAQPRVCACGGVAHEQDTGQAPDHACSFCAIPGFRGAFRSKPFDTALAEARSAEIGRDPPRYAAQPSSAELRRAEEISRDEPSSAELSRGCRRGCSSSEACARST